MLPIEVTRLSSKGQVVLPQALRNKLKLSEGTKFIVLGEEDTVILKKVEIPSLITAKRLMQKSQVYAKKVGLKRGDVKTAIALIRSKSR